MIDSQENDIILMRGNKIGSGGFSNVYEIFFRSPSDSPDKTKIGALKFIPCSQNSGLESLMETHIMRYINHPYINRAWGVQSDGLGNINIIQPLAIGDASSIIRKKMNKLSHRTLKKWLWQIVTAVAHLHSQGILHGDIKAGNILIFSDTGKSIKFSDVNPTGRSEACEALDNTHTKLNDFSLSRLISNPLEGTHDLPRHTSYTSTHRAIEVWKNITYSFPADIWALGCTFYEIAYGCLLFQDQGNLSKNDEEKANIQAFEDWNSFDITPSKYEYTHIQSPKSNNIPYIPTFKRCKISSEWSNPENEVLNDLILSTLNINANERLTIWDIIEHEYFDDIRAIKPPLINTPIDLRIEETKISNIESIRINAVDHPESLEIKEGPDSLLPPPEERQFPLVTYAFDGVSQSIIDETTNMMPNFEVMQLSIFLYQRARESTLLPHIPRPSLKACVIVANKLLYRGPPTDFDEIGQKYLKDEINLCLCLNYKMLPHTFDKKTIK